MNTEAQKSSILVVDDDPTNLKLVNEILKGDYKVFLAPSGERALVFLETRIPDLILLDLEMPGMNGYDVIKKLKQTPAWKDIPVIFLTGQEGRDKEQEALDLGAVDYVLKPITVGILRSRVALHIELAQYRKSLESMVDERTTQLRRTQDTILDILASMTSFRDNETGAHIKRTTIYAQMLLEKLRKSGHADYQIEQAYADSIVKAAKLHDIGKVAVPDNILLKPARLSEAEFEMIKQHTVFGALIIDNAMEELGDTSDFLSVAREIIISHHEKWDGRGYPNQLAGKDIPISGRIMAIADVYDALISHRPYKPSYTHDVAVKTILQDAGTHFDPTLVELTKDEIMQFDAIARQHIDEKYTEWS
ncbi:response regulator [Christensenellaceae bacterium OttesenSCG-928-K19]|nr:response regulator [Christensenellaceae bacterium OttesenSCG-928-K19]